MAQQKAAEITTTIPRARILVAFAAMLILLSALAIEGGARLFFAIRDVFRDNVVNIDPSVLDEYEIQDSRQRWNWQPKPGYSATIDQIILAKRNAGKILSEELLKERALQLKVAKNAVIMRINDDGFKGPDIDKTHSRIRILTIGDSCTFGTIFDEYSYPRTLERELKRLEKHVEVINAGVEGYGPANVLARIDEFKALRPEITTIYIGWNVLYQEPESHGIESYLKSIKLFRKAYEKIQEKIFGHTQVALAAYTKPKRVEHDAPEVRALDGFQPSFLTDLENVVKEMRGAGSKVVLLTLPGLFVMDEEPTPRALEVGHLPTFTDNPYVLAKMSMEYNKLLRRLAKEQGLVLVDLEEWSRESLRPRDKYFFDSVHLYEEGQVLIGQYLATQLVSLLSHNSEK